MVYTQRYFDTLKEASVSEVRTLCCYLEVVDIRKGVIGREHYALILFLFSMRIFSITKLCNIVLSLLVGKLKKKKEKKKQEAFKERRHVHVCDL